MLLDFTDRKSGGMFIVQPARAVGAKKNSHNDQQPQFFGFFHIKNRCLGPCSKYTTIMLVPGSQFPQNCVENKPKKDG